MAKLSNLLLGIVNFITLIVSLLIIAISVWFQIEAGPDCEKFLQLPILILGACLFFISIFGLFGACCQLNTLIFVYIFMTFMLMVAMVGFSVFALVVTNKAGNAVSGHESKGFSIRDFSSWLHGWVDDPSAWGDVKKCLKTAKVCENLDYDEGFLAKRFATLKASCCVPPPKCEVPNRLSSTYWIFPIKSYIKSDDYDNDCKLWSNDKQKLCYSCKSCKEGAIQTIKNEWTGLAILNACLILLLIIMYSLACCATTRNKSPDKNIC